MCQRKCEYSLSEIRNALLEYANTLDPADLFPTVVAVAAKLATSDPYAFLIACCLDRGQKAEIIWTIPYDIKNFLGHLDPFKIHQMSQDELAEMFIRLPRKPYYMSAAPRTLKELTRIVMEECGGDASKLWFEKHSWEVNEKLDSIYGVGVGIANMTVLLIEQVPFRIFEPSDHPKMDIKPDRLTKRVLYRMGISQKETEKAAIEAARKISPDFPGAIDGALWEIGRKFCHPNNPNCDDCPMNCVCKKWINHE